ncbi:MAG: bifunctional DNA-formamidopyrimidine glycosylase/DNA-(apurinic or apyrimidinic site) lyase [Fimbriimonadaceae bacterium]|nr:bifunctional DNA-formamidopyrimidine glycosylase/DNA-(apurinic or apyrimidinic site) lyase [Alphaproteobacteria bacterium]
MPELPEVETVCSGLAAVMTGKTIRHIEQRRANLRFPFPDDFAARLKGRKIISISRRAKYILIQLDAGETLIVHLGMSGRFVISGGKPKGFHHETGGNSAHDHVVLQLNDDVSVTYNDTRRFGFMDLLADDRLASYPMLAKLGIEPLGNELHAGYLNGAFRNRKTSLKAALMDQRIVAGLGNIYVCEALHRAHLSPRRMAASIATKNGPPGKRIEPLVRAIRDVLGDAIRAGGSSLRDYAQVDGELGYFQHAFRVYDRENVACPSPGCHGTVNRIVQNGRSTFFCPSCQK